MKETSVSVNHIIELTSMSYVPANCIAEKHRSNWPEDTYVLPEYCFAFACDKEIVLSGEHSEYLWTSYENAMQMRMYDSNKTALYELDCRLKEI